MENLHVILFDLEKENKIYHRRSKELLKISRTETYCYKIRKIQRRVVQFFFIFISFTENVPTFEPNSPEIQIYAKFVNLARLPIL